MKKILLAAVAALAIVGCSQNEEIEKAGEKAEINFSGVVGKGTRAVEVDLAGLQSSANGFHVYAYNTGGNKVGAGELDKLLITNEQIVWKTTKWEGTNTYYWPTTDYVQFFAYASASTSVLTTGLKPAANKYPAIENYTVPASSTDQEDLLVAQITDKVKTADATINFTFSHALTQVNFSVKKKLTDNYTYSVTKLSLENIGSVATYNYKDGWGVAGTLATYDCTIAENSITVTNDNKIDLTGDKFILLPQTLGATAQIVIEYKVLDSEGTEYYKTPEGGKIVSLADEVWAPNNKMRYTLALTNDATPISWDVTKVNGWTSEGNDETNTDKEPATPTTPDA